MSQPSRPFSSPRADASGLGVVRTPPANGQVAAPAASAVASAGASAVAMPGGPDSTFRTMAELMPQLVWSTTADGYHDYFNERWYAYTGMPRPAELGGEHEAPQGWNWKDYLHPDDYERTLTLWQHSLQTGDPYEIQYRFKEAATGAYRWFLARAVPLYEDGRIVRWFGTCTDIDEATHTASALAVLADAGATLAAPGDVDSALRRAAGLVVPRLADWCAIDLVDDDAPPPAPGVPAVRRVVVAHVDPSKVALAHELAERYPEDPDAPNGLYAVLRSGDPQLLAEIPDDLLVAAARDAEHLRIVRALGLCSAVTVPILASEGPRRVYGAITLVSAEAGRRYAPRDVATVQELARRVALALERARLTATLERERARLAEQGHELAAQNEALQQQAVELEMQAAQLQEQAAELEAQADDLQVTNAELTASEARFRSLYESMTQGVVYQDADGEVLDANPAALRLLGVPLDALVRGAGRELLFDVLDAEGRPLPREAQPALRALRTGEVVAGARLRLRPRDGAAEERWVRVDAVPERRVGEERPFRAYSLFDDITDEVRAERERQRLAEAERSARAEMVRVFEQAPVAIAVTRGPRHVFELANATYRRLVPARELVGHAVRDALPDVDVGMFAVLDRVYATGEPFVGVELEIPYDRDGTGAPRETYFNLIYQPLFDGDGHVSGIVTVAHDVTDQVQARRAVERARQSAEQALAAAEHAQRQAEEANAAKSQFLRTVSHELRTPLNAIAGYSELVAMGLRGPTTDEQRSDLERIKRASQHLLALINDILSFAKLEAGQVELSVESVPVESALGEVESLVVPQLGAKGLTADFGECPPGLAVRADAERLRQVLLNLLSNAIKFTPSGGRITIACATTGERVAIRVRDTGIGIPADALERVFDPFVQVGRDLRAPSDGVGLGLAISRDLARRMGGDLTAESEVGVGSTFTVWLARA